MCGFLLLFNSNMGSILDPPVHLAPEMHLQNLSDLDIGLSRSLRSDVIILLDSPYVVSYYLKIKSDRPIGLPVYDFLLVFHSNMSRNGFSYVLSLGPAPNDPKMTLNVTRSKIPWPKVQWLI